MGLTSHTSFGTPLANNANRLLNIGLRSITLSTRFLLIFFLAKYLEPASVGYYGLFTATVGYCLYFVGLDFYTYTTREILKTPNQQRGRLLKGQAALSGILYLALLPIAYVLLQYAGWPAGLVVWFFPILMLEHFNQEIFRLLVALSDQITASLILFIRQGSWALVIVGLMAWDISSRHLQAVMACWAGAGVAAALLGVWRIRRFDLGGWRDSIDWHWIKKGIAVSVAFLIATLALRAIQTVDRYWLEALGGIEIVGAYVLFLGVASTLMVFLDAGIFAYAYPELIKLHQQQRNDLTQQKLRFMLASTMLLSAGFGLVSWLLLPYLLDWINNPVYTQAIGLYPWLLSAVVVNAISMVPHYALYARGNDKPIIYSHIAALVTFILTVWALGAYWSALAVPVGLTTSYTVILIWKTVAFWHSARNSINRKAALQSAQLL